MHNISAIGTGGNIGGGVAGTGLPEDCLPIVPDPSTLPVTFGSIVAVIKNKELNITWTTLSEINNLRFDVQLSNDGINFTKAGTLNSQAADGNSSTPLHYTFSVSLNNATGRAVAGGLVIIALLAGSGIMIRRKRKASIIAFAIAVASATTSFSCNKNDIVDATDLSKVFVRIVQVDIDGKTTASQTVKATVK